MWAVPQEKLSDRITRLWRSTGRYSSEREFLRRCKISEGYLTQFRAREKTVPGASFHSTQASRMAAELGVTVADLLGTSRLHGAPGGDRHPSRTAAIGAARLLGYPESAIESVLADDPERDPGPLYWFRRIEAAGAAIALPPARLDSKNR